VQGRRCYPIERCLKTIRKKCRNKCKIEASIAEAYILEEVSNFTTTYYGDELQSVHNPSVGPMLRRRRSYRKKRSSAEAVCIR
jgi:hypothetical protein